MPKRKTDSGGPVAKKSRAPKTHVLPEKFPNGEILKDLTKREWRLGDVIGQGGFGLIYLASDQTETKVTPDANYVVKIEPATNGPLFCEIHFYQRVAKPELITAWRENRGLKYLGVPAFIGCGQHIRNGTTYRFMVMQRFSTDLQKLFEGAGKRFSKATVYALGLRLLDALEYLHEHEYIHADVKASNCLLGYKNGKTDTDQVYLVDYGLACKYIIDGNHKEYKEDPKKAHDGTVEFTSIDAHKGVAPSRRGDLEILGYCMLQWLCSRLPWETDLTNKDKVASQKEKFMKNIPSLIKACFPAGDDTSVISSYLTTVQKLGYSQNPDYEKLRSILQGGLTKQGQKDVWKLQLEYGGKSKQQASSTPKKAAKRRSESPGKKGPVSKKIAVVSSSSTPKLLNAKSPKRTASSTKKLKPSASEGTPSGSGRGKSPRPVIRAPGILASPRRNAHLGKVNGEAEPAKALVRKTAVRRRAKPKALMSDSSVQTSPGLVQNK
ncbi:hypothetical protein ACJMK2_037635 [Sinanodonta woodiana]|uniref:non-specific serine/threonine protein kinase n=1 Tax=Sinanodonta woodiana TaxID=1069815 RepID=A0ABD3WN56_SINWO